MRAAEFFAGMGLMRAGLESVGVRTVFANDIDGTKAALYRANWGDDALVVDDIRNLRGDDIPDAEVATASFPCVDMSLAGNLAGLGGAESGLIVEFCRILAEMGERRPQAVIVENVPGFRTVNDGRDFARVVEMIEALGYAVEHVVINAASFVPQSRPRIFLLGVRGSHPRSRRPRTPSRRDLRTWPASAATGGPPSAATPSLLHCRRCSAAGSTIGAATIGCGFSALTAGRATAVRCGRSAATRLPARCARPVAGRRARRWSGSGAATSTCAGWP